MEKATSELWNYVKRIFRYKKRTVAMGIVYSGQSALEKNYFWI